MIKPQGSRVLVELIDYDLDADGIELIDSHKEVQQKAKVIAVGEGTLLESGEIVTPDVTVGDTVIVTQTGGTMVRDGASKYQIVVQDNIIGVVE